MNIMKLFHKQKTEQKTELDALTKFERQLLDDTTANPDQWELSARTNPGGTSTRTLHNGKTGVWLMLAMKDTPSSYGTIVVHQAITWIDGTSGRAVLGTSFARKLGESIQDRAHREAEAAAAIVIAEIQKTYDTK